MPIKYECPKCNKRFVDWGAEKLGFKCPECEEQELLRVGAPAATEPQTPTLRRQPKKAPKKLAPSPEESTDSLDDDNEAFLDDDDDDASSDDNEESFGDEANESAESGTAKASNGNADDAEDDDGEDLPEDLDFDASHTMDGGLEDFEDE